MNSARSTFPRWLKILLWIGASGLVGLLLLAVWVWQTLQLSSEARVLQRECVGVVGVPRVTRFQASVGPVALVAARQIVRHVKSAPPEAAVALAALRRGSVGVYEYSHDVALDGAGLARCDEAMRLRGWHRIVGVRDGADTVLIYATADAGGDRLLNLCLAVFEERNLVVVSGRVDGRVLLPLVEQQARKHLASR